MRAKLLAAKIQEGANVEDILEELLNAAREIIFDTHAETEEELKTIYDKLNGKWVAVYYELGQTVDINAFKKYVEKHNPHRFKKLGW